jgi:hypothetical protein
MIITNNTWIIDMFLSIFVFVIMIDPSDTLLGLKSITFGLLFLMCLLSYKTIWKPARVIIIIVYAVISISIVMGYLQGFTFDIQIVKLIYKTYVTLFLLLWINKLSFLEKMFLPTLIIALTTIVIHCLITFYPSVEQFLSFLSTKYNLMRISRRTFIGIDILSTYYTSAALLIVPLALYLHKALFKEEKKMTYYCLSIICFIALLFTGTRACMLSAMFLTSLMIIIRIYKSKNGKLVATIIICVAMICSCYLVYKLLNDREEASLQVRSGHLSSYKKLVTEHPLILVLGEGAGSKFYSEGFKEETAQTEWSYAELIRWFGFFGAGIFMFVYLFPLYIIYRKRKILPYSLPVQAGYSFYLLIAGTNPLLLGSNGLLMLLIMYSYALNPKYEQV